MTNPPPRGVGIVCELRSFGTSMISRFRLQRRNNSTPINVIPNTAKYTAKILYTVISSATQNFVCSK